MTTRAPNAAPTPEERIAMREADHLSQSRRSRSRDHKAAVAARRADERRRDRLEHLKDEAAARRSFRKFKNSMLRDTHLWKPLRLRLQERISARFSKKKAQDSRGWKALPSVGLDIVDSKGRRGVFLSIHYDGAKTTDRGVFRRRIEYAVNSRDVVLGSDGRPMLVSNVTKDLDEAVALADEIEAFARAERLNGKVCFNLIIGYPRTAAAHQRELILRRFCQRTFADEGLPFMALNHEPKRAGKVHNSHGHITGSLRSVHREGPYRYLISKDLRVDLDGEEGMARMRRILAEVTTQVMREAGFEHQYTHLSNAARGIALIPQEGLTKEQSEAAKRGENVAANERNNVLARTARAYVLEQIKKTVEASKAPLLTRLPWAFTRAPELAKSGLRAVVPQRLGTVLGLRPRGEFIRVQLAKTAPAITPVQVLAGPRGSTNQAPSLSQSQLRKMPQIALANTRYTNVARPVGLPLNSYLAGAVHRVDHPVADKAKLVGAPAIPAHAALPKVQAPQHGQTAKLTNDPVREPRVELVAGALLTSANLPLLTPLTPPSRTIATAVLPVSRAALKPVTSPVKANASVTKLALLWQRNHPVAPLTPAARLSTIKLVLAPELVATIKLQPALPQFPHASLVESLRPDSGGAFIIGLPPVSARKVPVISWSEPRAADRLFEPRRLAPVTKLAVRPSELLSVPLVRVPARKFVNMVQPISAPNQSPALMQLIAAPPAPKALPTAARLTPKAALVRVIMPAQLVPSLVPAAPISLAALPRLVGKSPLVEPPLRPSAGEFTWLRAKVDAMRVQLAAAHPLEPSRMSVEKEKTQQRLQPTSTSANAETSQLDQLCWAFLLAKRDEERRRAAVHIRKNKAALMAMTRRADPLWIAEQTRFQLLQAGVGDRTQSVR